MQTGFPATSSQLTPTRVSLGISDITLDDHLLKTGQNTLPQVPLLQNALQSLSQENLLEEAYLRGSFSSGKADNLSDIDLFAVVSPDNLPKAHKHFTDYIDNTGKIILGCHDKFVKNYGGIGFMYLCADPKTDALFQFDIYFAMKGVPPRELLVNAPRVYMKNAEYCWVEEQAEMTAQVDALPQETKDFIADHTKLSEEKGVVSCYNDLLVGLFIMDKHLKRQQIARAFNDNFQNTNAMIDMLRHGINDTSYHSPLYAFDDMSHQIAVSNDAGLQDHAVRIRELMDKNASTGKIRKMFELGTDMLQTFAPDYYHENQDKLDILNKRVFKSIRASL